MMNKNLVIAFLAAFTVSLSAQEVTIREVPAITPARGAGTWALNGSRLFQNDAAARLAKANLAVPQEGEMIYEFNIRYEGGAEDGHGGVGIHIFGNSALNAPSWGSGKSYLLWLNYDENPLSKDIPAGLSAQVYRSTSHSEMTLVNSISLNDYLDFLDGDALYESIPFRIWVDGDSGEVRVYDPTVDLASVYYIFYLDKRDIPAKGEWAALRTNGLKASFELGL